LSLADPKVADEIKLSPDHRAQITKIFADWQQTTQPTMRDAFEQARQNNQFPNFESRLSPARQKLDREKKAAEARVEAVLSTEEKAAWQAAIGEPFTFRPDPPRQRPDGRPRRSRWIWLWRPRRARPPGGPGGFPGGPGGPGGPGVPPPPPPADPNGF
jgi:hypothetical protein